MVTFRSLGQFSESGWKNHAERTRNVLLKANENIQKTRSMEREKGHLLKFLTVGVPCDLVCHPLLPRKAF